MPIPSNFPKSPFEVLLPETRWKPDHKIKTSETLDLPPLVEKIRYSVKNFRDSNYREATETSRSLLNWWFNVDKSDGFKYYFAQQEAIETLIYLYEVVKIKENKDLLAFDSSEKMTPEFFEESWRRHLVKMATGSGKTKVLSLAITWSYFHKLYEDDSDLSTNFLVVAPNIIVLERLLTDLGRDLKIFNIDPIIPDNGYEGKYWKKDFKLNVHIQDEINPHENGNNLFITNVHRIYKSRKNLDEEFLNYLSGVSKKPTVSDFKLLKTLESLDSLVVLNDEAHHIGLSESEWFKSIEHLHLNLVQKNSKLSLQIDVTATPKTSDGKDIMFPHIVSDYPLVEAIYQGIVKRPQVPTDSTQSKLEENINSSEIIEKYEKILTLGVEEYLKGYEIHISKGKKPILFVMASDTEEADVLKSWIETAYPEKFKGKTLLIHTNAKGEISMAKNNLDELNELRKQSREIDSLNNPYNAIVSVLMLKEGWDVKNVTTIIGLRPYTSGEILPEQTLGRGLRKMYGQGVDEEVTLIGTKNFIDFIKKIDKEGVEVEEVILGPSSPPRVPLYVKVDFEKDVEKLDIELPRLNKKFNIDIEVLEETTFDDLNLQKIKVKDYSITTKEEKYDFQDAVTEEWSKSLSLIIQRSLEAQTFIQYYSTKLKKDLRLPFTQAKTTELLITYIENYLFETKVNINDENIVQNLARNTQAIFLINKTFEQLLAKSIVEKIDIETSFSKFKLKDTPLFWVKSSEFINSEKSIFDKTITDVNSKLELNFALQLDRWKDVISFTKIYDKLNFKFDYKNIDGKHSNYTPDFIVRTNQKNENKFISYIVETKGQRQENVSLKMQRISNWCNDVNNLHLATDFWDFVFVDENDFYKYNFETFNDLAEVFTEYK